MQGFAIIIGACKIIPPSPKLAVLLVMWMYGAVPGFTYEDYRKSYVDGGGQNQVAHIEKCFLDWPGKLR